MYLKACGCNSTFYMGGGHSTRSETANIAVWWHGGNIIYCVPSPLYNPTPPIFQDNLVPLAAVRLPCVSFVLTFAASGDGPGCPAAGSRLPSSCRASTGHLFSLAGMISWRTVQYPSVHAHEDQHFKRWRLDLSKILTIASCFRKSLSGRRNPSDSIGISPFHTLSIHGAVNSPASIGRASITDHLGRYTEVWCVIQLSATLYRGG
jgi:hypothetical protein